MIKNTPTIRECIAESWRDIREEDIQAVAGYLRNEPISLIDGGIMSEFEQAFAEFVGAKYAVAYCNGTAAIHAAVFAIGASAHTEIILPQYSYHGTVNACLENRSKVVLCDFDENTLNIDCDDAERNITDSTIAMVVTHCWGNPVNMDALRTIKKKYGIRIISDASHAHGAEWKGTRIGALDVEDIACFSLGKNKLISVGELGVAVTNDVELYDQLLFMGHPNRVPDALRLNSLKEYSNGVGNKYRPHPLSMVLALQQLRRYEIKMKYNIATNEKLIQEIQKVPGFIPIDSYYGAKRVYWKTQFRLDHNFWGNLNDDCVIAALQQEGLPLQQFHNYNITEHEKIWSHERYKGQVINCAHRKTPKDVIVLPGYIQISSDSIEQIVNAFEKVSIMWGERNDFNNSTM